MDLAWQIEIVEQLIAEDDQVTIKEYLQLIDEVTRIIPVFNEYGKRDNPKKD